MWKPEKAEKTWEIPVTAIVSAVQVPGRKARFVRLETRPATPDHLLLKQVKLYGKIT